MSGVITEGVVTVWPATVADILNGDDADHDTFSPPLVSLAQRTKFDHEELFTRGVRRIKNFTSTGTAKAVTTGTVATGDVATIAGLGLFQYDASTAGDPETPPLMYLVTGTAGGIWRSLGLGRQALNTANGAAPLDASVKVPHANLRGQIVAIYGPPDTAAATGGTTTGTGALVEITGPGPPSGVYVEVPNLIAGDLLLFSVGYLAVPAANTFLELSYRLRRTDGTSVSFATQVAMGFVYVPAAFPAVTAPVVVTGQHRVQAGDLSVSSTLRVHMNQKATSGSTAAASLSSFNITSASGIVHYRGPA